MTASPRYRGRFAPSPTGPLHFGSLVAALASCLDARARGGEWLVRIEDVDRPREVAGAADAQLATLEAFGFAWDGAVLRQSARTHRYDAALRALLAAGHAYVCGCSRRQIAAIARHGVEGWIYPGTCRALGLADGPHRAVRLRTDDVPVGFVDRVHGAIACRVERTLGDCVIRRADGLHAYQLAVVVDDAAQGITQVVRGADLLHATPWQIVLQRRLGLPTPGYAHVPVVLGPDGRKLSKQDSAHPVDRADPLPALLAAWDFLGQRWLSGRPGTVAEFWEEAPRCWDLARVPAQAPSCDGRVHGA
jgi:glutamyl-Q tRNA(Asp) synthetase